MLADRAADLRLPSPRLEPTSNPPVNRLTQVFGLADFRAGSSDETLVLDDVRQKIGQKLARGSVSQIWSAPSMPDRSVFAMALGVCRRREGATR
jgi:hypothetical protein